MDLLLLQSQKAARMSLYTQENAPIADFEQGETRPISVGLILDIPAPLGNRIYDPQDLTGWTFRAAIGSGNLPPVAGTFTITFNSGADEEETTAPIPYNAGAATIEAALNALASVVSGDDGEFTVKEDNGLFIVTFGYNGAQVPLVGNPENLAPLSLIEVAQLIAGGIDNVEVQELRIAQNPSTFCDLTIASPAPSAPVAVLQVGGSGLNHKIRVTFTPLPYDGKWTLIVGGIETALMDWDGDESDVQAATEALSSVGVGNVLVSQETVGSYLIAFQGTLANTNMGTITTDATGLLVIPMLSGILDLRVPGIDLLLGAEGEVETYFAVEGTPPGGTVQKFLRQSVSLVSSIIPPASEVPQPYDTYLTETQSDGRYATTAQGAKANTALQPVAIGTTVQPYSATIPPAYLGTTSTTALAGNTAFQSPLTFTNGLSSSAGTVTPTYGTTANTFTQGNDTRLALAVSATQDLPDVSMGGSGGALALGKTSNIATGGSFTSPALPSTVGTPPARFAIKASSTSAPTITYPNSAGTSETITILAGEVVTFRQKSTSGWGAESGNKPLTQLDARYAPLASPSFTGTVKFPDGTPTQASTGQLLFGTSSNVLYLYSGTGGLIINNQGNTAVLLTLTNAGALTLGGNASFGGVNISAATNPALTYGGSLALTRTASGTVAVGTTPGATDGTVLTTNLFGAGGFSTGLVTKTAAYTAAASDHKILVDSTGGARTITLPTAVGIAGKEFIVKDWKGTAATNNITIATTGGQTIDGAATKVIASAYFSISLVSDGANWSMF